MVLGILHFRKPPWFKTLNQPTPWKPSAGGSRGPWAPQNTPTSEPSTNARCDLPEAPAVVGWKHGENTLRLFNVANWKITILNRSGSSMGHFPLGRSGRLYQPWSKGLSWAKKNGDIIRIFDGDIYIIWIYGFLVGNSISMDFLKQLRNQYAKVGKPNAIQQ